ncbi:hypothetical protein [Aurantiacibacter sp. MUD61]|nr:hypothetical protein [Aurantiacibacter sp. MUD61]
MQKTFHVAIAAAHDIFVQPRAGVSQFVTDETGFGRALYPSRNMEEYCN